MRSSEPGHRALVAISAPCCRVAGSLIAALRAHAEMASRYGCTNADAVALRGCVRHCISRIARRSGIVQASGLGITRCFSTRHGFMGLSRRPQTRPTTLLRLRLIRFLRVARRCACLSLPDQRRAGIPHVALLCWHLPNCDACRAGVFMIREFVQCSDDHAAKHRAVSQPPSILRTCMRTMKKLAKIFLGVVTLTVVVVVAGVCHTASRDARAGSYPSPLSAVPQFASDAAGLCRGSSHRAE